MEDKVGAKSAVLQKPGRFAEFIGQVFGIMGVRTEGHDLSPQIPVADDNILTGIGHAKPIFIASGINLQSDVLFYKGPENFVDDFPVFCIRIISVLIGTVPDYIIQMAEYIKVGISLQILQGAFKVFQVGAGLFPSLKIGWEIRVPAMYQMDGADDKIKGIGKDQIMMFFAQVWLKSQFDSHTQINLIPVLLLQRKQTVKIFPDIKFKTDSGFGVVIVHMIRQAQMPDSFFNSLFHHNIRRDAAVSRKRCMDMVIR